jgi:hypothetical protein
VATEVAVVVASAFASASGAAVIANVAVGGTFEPAGFDASAVDVAVVVVLVAVVVAVDVAVDAVPTVDVASAFALAPFASDPVAVAIAVAVATYGAVPSNADNDSDAAGANTPEPAEYTTVSSGVTTSNTVPSGVVVVFFVDVVVVVPPAVTSTVRVISLSVVVVEPSWFVFVAVTVIFASATAVPAVGPPIA